METIMLAPIAASLVVAASLVLAVAFASFGARWL
jgi:hypothetical protein